MTTYSTEIHGQAATAPTVTGRIAKCKVYGVQWQIQSPVNTDAKFCDFCGAGEDAIVIIKDDNPPETIIEGGL